MECRRWHRVGYIVNPPGLNSIPPQETLFINGGFNNEAQRQSER
jgi:hypothetical protein